MAHYVAAKAGVTGFGKSFALALAPHGVTVNSIAPGPIETPLIKDLSTGWRKAKSAELPLDRFGTPRKPLRQHCCSPRPRWRSLHRSDARPQQRRRDACASTRRVRCMLR
ncbi:SDR family oxidoreductase [Rhodococcus pyridinivorans]|nr:SDR family oxidoreductase [Rhodococcus pyridinivorans]